MLVCVCAWLKDIKKIKWTAQGFALNANGTKLTGRGSKLRFRVCWDVKPTPRSKCFDSAASRKYDRKWTCECERLYPWLNYCDKHKREETTSSRYAVMRSSSKMILKCFNFKSWRRKQNYANSVKLNGFWIQLDSVLNNNDCDDDVEHEKLDFLRC